MSRFAEAMLSDAELKQITDRFGKAIVMLKVDELKVEHQTAEECADVFGDKFSYSTMKSVLSMRLGERWLSTTLDWMTVEDAREGHFESLAQVAMWDAKRMHNGEGETTEKASRFTALAKDLFTEKK